MWIFEIPERNIERLFEQLNKYVRRARKLKHTPPAFEVIWEREEQKKNGKYEYYYYVTVEGPRPFLKGWKFVATIDHTPDGNILKSVPGEASLPLRFRTANPGCEHCNKIRRRKDTFVLLHAETGEYKQIGRQCLADFFDGESPADVAALMEAWTEAEEIALEMEGENYPGGAGESRHGLEEVLRLTQAVIECCGWTSRSKARDTEGVIATANYVSALLNDPKYWDSETKKLSDMLVYKDEHQQMVVDALEWVRGMPLDVEDDYLYNLQVACRGESLQNKLLGLACSLMPAHRRHLGIQKENAERRPSEFVGTQGERSVFEVKLKYVSEPMAGYMDFSSTRRVVYEDMEGNTLLWWASRDYVGEVDGPPLKIAATVKKHEVYQSKRGPVNQTVITRVTEWNGKPIKKKKGQ